MRDGAAGRTARNRAGVLADAMAKALADPRPLPPRRFRMLCAVLGMLALLLRLPTLASRSFWLDETYSAWFAALPLHALWTSVPLYETHPPFYYTILKGWIALTGPGEAALRSLSVAASVLTVLLLPLSTRFAGRLAAGPMGADGRLERAGLLAGLLLAMNAASIQYAQQARPYALQALAGTLAVLCSCLLVRATARDAFPWRPAAGLALAAGLTLWLHNTGVFAALGIWCGMAAALLASSAPRRQRMRQALAVGAAGIGALLAWSPFVPMLLRQRATLAGMSYWITFHAKGMLAAWTVISGGRVLHYPAALLVLLGFGWLWRHARPLFWHLGCVLSLPILALGAYSWLVQPVFLSRLFLWLGPLGMTLVALGIVALRPRWRLPALAAVLALSGWSAGAFYRSQTEDWRGLLAQVAREARPGDVIVAFPNEIQMPVSYYMRPGSAFAAAAPVVYLPGPFPAMHLPRRYTGNAGAPQVAPEDVERLRTLLPGYRRVWLIERLAGMYDPGGLVLRELGACCRLLQTIEGDGANIRLYGLGRAVTPPAPAIPVRADR
jgi:mannosyltransferase